MKKILLILLSLTLFISISYAKPIAIYKTDEGVSVIYPVSENRHSGETEKVWLERVFKEATPEGKEYIQIDSSELPQIREDRNAWKIKNNKVVVDQIKAKKLRDKGDRAEKIRKEKERILEEQAISNLEERGEIKKNEELK